jgi:hypothetical protein
MTTMQHLPSVGARLTPRARAAATLAVLLARLASRLPPRHLRRVLARVSRSARPATYGEALAAREAVTSVSLACRALEGCLLRSLATALLCRLRGTWPAWRVGVRTVPPFGAHAWVEADGEMVGELYPPGYFSTLLSVAGPDR